jgi:hypothetical protein
MLRERFSETRWSWVGRRAFPMRRRLFGMAAGAFQNRNVSSPFAPSKGGNMRHCPPAHLSPPREAP